MDDWEWDERIENDCGQKKKDNKDQKITNMNQRMESETWSQSNDPMGKGHLCSSNTPLLCQNNVDCEWGTGMNRTDRTDRQADRPKKNGEIIADWLCLCLTFVSLFLTSLTSIPVYLSRYWGSWMAKRDSIHPSLVLYYDLLTANTSILWGHDFRSG